MTRSLVGSEPPTSFSGFHTAKRGTAPQFNRINESGGHFLEIWTNLITTFGAPDSLGMGHTGVVTDRPKPRAGCGEGGQEELTQ